MLQPVFDPFHRSPQFHGREGYHHILRVKFPSYAKAAADIDFDEVDLRFGYVEKGRQDRPVKMRHLGGSPDGECIPARVIAGHESTGFEGVTRMAMDFERLLA